MCESRTGAFLFFGQCSEKMVFQRGILFSSTQNVLAQYLRTILTELLSQEGNGFESDYVSFRLEQLIFLGAKSICFRSTQLVSILRRALAMTENSHYVMPFRVMTICYLLCQAFCVMLFRDMPFWVIPICVIPFYVMPFRVTTICVMPFRVMTICVMPFRVMQFCVMPILLYAFSRYAYLRYAFSHNI